jgi:hypothetical protein
MGRRLRYQVAVSLDGFIAGPHGESDWIVMLNETFAFAPRARRPGMRLRPSAG